MVTPAGVRGALCCPRRPCVWTAVCRPHTQLTLLPPQCILCLKMEPAQSGRKKGLSRQAMCALWAVVRAARPHPAFVLRQLGCAPAEWKGSLNRAPRHAGHLCVHPEISSASRTTVLRVLICADGFPPRRACVMGPRAGGGRCVLVCPSSVSQAPLRASPPRAGAPQGSAHHPGRGSFPLPTPADGLASTIVFSSIRWSEK